MDKLNTTLISIPSNSTTPEIQEDNGLTTTENNSTALSSRATKNWKKIKEISEKQQDKRPPWKMVSLSTLPKADKSAILRAKLLDASRRMRAGKIPVSVQTDLIPAKLLKEVNTQVQSDLIQVKDAGNLTDGTISIKSVGPIVLTYSVAQMTDMRKIQNTETQTDTPGILQYDNFFENQNHNLNEIFNDDNNDNGCDFFKSLKYKYKLLQPIKDINIFRNDKDEDFLKHNVKMGTTSAIDNPKNLNLRYLSSTKSLWNFDNASDDYYNGEEVWKETRNMKLFPNLKRKFSIITRSNINNYGNKVKVWSPFNDRNDIFLIMKLLDATIDLLNIFKKISIALGPPDIKSFSASINNAPSQYKKIDYNADIKFLSHYWYPILQDISSTMDRKFNELKRKNV